MAFPWVRAMVEQALDITQWQLLLPQPQKGPYLPAVLFGTRTLSCAMAAC